MPQLAVQRLFAYTGNEIITDFSQFRIVVPTAEAGRLLRESLAEHCPAGLVGLEVLMPDMLLRPDEETPATTAEVLAAWRQTLAAFSPQKTIPLLGPKFPEMQNDPATGLAAGALLQNCRKELAADGISTRQAAQIFRQAGMHEQAERFEILTQLESNFLRICPQDPVQLQLKAVPRIDDTRTIIVLHCPDLRGAAVKFLQSWQGRVEYWIHAPENLANTFDEYGRARPDWHNRDFPVNTKEQLRITVHAEEQVAILNSIRQDTARKIRAVGVLDPALAGAWQDYLRRSQDDESQVFFPAMRPLPSRPWTRLFCALLELRHPVPSRETVATILQHGFQADRDVLEKLDKCQKEKVAQDLTSLQQAAGPGKLSNALGLLALWQKQLRNASHGILSECWNILKSIGESPDCPPTDRRESTAELVALESLISAAEHAGGRSADLICALFRQLCSTAQLRPVSSGEETLDAVGFLELPWYGDELVFLAGLSENALSSKRFSDPFLPEQARKLLGVQTAEQCATADAFRFAAMQNTAQLRFLVCRYGVRQDALKPPAILMRCPAKDLPQRVQDLFGEDFVLPQQPESKPQLEPMKPIRKEPLKRQISVTDFSQYMRCPFTYYLQRVLRAENIDGKAIELDNAQSGTLLHDVIAGCENVLKGSGDEAEIFQAAEKQWAVFRHRFGEPPPGLLDLQFSIMKDNLLYFAEKQAVWYEQGWRLVRSEHDPQTTTIAPCSWAEFYHKVFPESPRKAWRETIEFKGRFDRLDAREIDGIRELCVIDYKTGTARTPAEKHLCTAAGLTEDEKNYRRAPETDKYWADLQLPLYVLMIRHLMPEEKADRIRAAYFNLPTAYASTGVYEFTELNEAHLVSAMQCADHVAERIYGPRPVFWPPRRYDNLFEPYGSALTEHDFDAKDFLLPQENAEEDMP